MKTERSSMWGDLFLQSEVVAFEDKGNGHGLPEGSIQSFATLRVKQVQAVRAKAKADLITNGHVGFWRNHNDSFCAISFSKKLEGLEVYDKLAPSRFSHINTGGGVGIVRIDEL